MSAMISLSKLSNTPDVKVNVNPNINVKTSFTTTSTDKPIESDVKVSYGETQEPKPKTYSEEEFKNAVDMIEYYKVRLDILRIINMIIKNNPFMLKGLIIMEEENLKKIIMKLVFAKDVQIDAEDVGQGCITKNTYRKINAIYVVCPDDSLKNLKYDYPGIMRELLEYGISTKYVW